MCACVCVCLCELVYSELHMYWDKGIFFLDLTLHNSYVFAVHFLRLY